MFVSNGRQPKVELFSFGNILMPSGQLWQATGHLIISKLFQLMARSKKNPTKGTFNFRLTFVTEGRLGFNAPYYDLLSREDKEGGLMCHSARRG